VTAPVKQQQQEIGGFLDDEDHRQHAERQKSGKNDKHDIVKTEESNDGKKTGFVSVRKLAPPKGWKAPPQKTDIDLLDLLDAEIPQTNNIAVKSKEETKQNTPQAQKNNATPTNYMDDLLSLDIGANSHQQNPSHNNNNGGFNFGHVQPTNPNLNFMGNMNQFASAPGFQDFNSFNQPKPNNFVSGPDFVGNNNQVNQNAGNIDFDFEQLAITSSQKYQPQAQAQPQAQGNQQQQAEKKEAAPVDDDDFFSDIANRNK